MISGIPVLRSRIPKINTCREVGSSSGPQVAYQRFQSEARTFTEKKKILNGLDPSGSR
jgi:hypothetical protein